MKALSVFGFAWASHHLLALGEMQEKIDFHEKY
jgi:hypothetical protein